ncbi:hypothetical protein [Undibacterium sp.]|jgi:hypothetical protein|uniref:hypothetical protein n=1 Tax=Undibacterium sp. TaxID=1914977 RepID=UPI002C6CF83F|nr:hypothetical protein [Undibacterium sp.]HTD04037.1 hypothetical protein [Undibacterium sp.]
MKNTSGMSGDSIMELLREVAEAFAGLATHAGRALMRLPLPRLMLICIGLAFMLTILPLALMLFILFLGVKLVLLLAVLAARKARRRPLPLGHSGGQPGE